MGDQVPNPQKNDLESALRLAERYAAAVATDLDAVVADMETERPWGGIAAAVFYAELKAARTQAVGGVDAFVSAFRTAHDAEPDQIDRSQWHPRGSVH